ncbi:sugar phosphate nucleotidyltransferase [Paenibacillus sp. JX-17]|uniref:Glucose-1-phosphate thymidylyltransferase n=1 Tax=Paenibacillus lacisoli TaxID=3064525 RepID=A0ABT9CCP1_9BACL|nr:sugar phosphate nucleotidyltransferase [Paenibacillus sp. JX-17]MDO7906997.1 sugar phosphate nucleotidyltransferase [Paenibacillus sp. JX-17]
MKGIILAGGTGSRLAPLTEMVNKHLLPVGRHPMISYGINRLKEAGITDILLIISKQSAGLYTQFLGSGSTYGVRLTYRIQDAAGGIADALELARHYVQPQEKFVVLLGDNLFVDDLGPIVQEYLKQPYGTAKVLLKQVDDPHRYGVPEFDPHDPEAILHIEEKPQHPKSDFCVTGIYMYDTSVFELIDGIVPSARGELEITDVNNRYAEQKALSYGILEQYWVDAGTFDSLEEAGLQMKNLLP